MLATLMIFGLVSGFVASKIINRSGEGLLLDIVLGIVGAVVGSLLFIMFGTSGVAGLDLHKFAVAVSGAMAVFVAYHVLVSGSR